MNTPITKPSSTGGLITYMYDKQGKQTVLLHKAGTAYSGKIAALEAKAQPTPKEKK